MPFKTDPINQANEVYQTELRKRDNQIRSLGTEIEDLKKQRDILKKEQEGLQSKVLYLKDQVTGLDDELAERRKEFELTQDKLRSVLADKEQQLLKSADAQMDRAKSLDLRHNNAADREHQIEVKKSLLINILTKSVENFKTSLDKEVEQLKGI